MNHPPRQLRRQTPVRRSRARRPDPRRSTARRRRLGWRGRLILAALAVIVVSFTWAIFARMFAPAGNTTLNRFDAIIVLGNRADSEGNPTPELLARVTEGVHEYERGVAPRLILTGGLTGPFVEAKVMARVAEAQGVPPSAILIEPEAMDTIHNACYSTRILKQRGGRSAEVVSTDYHLPRAGLIFSRFPLQWRLHAAPPLAPQSGGSKWLNESMETLKTVRYLVYAEWAERCTP